MFPIRLLTYRIIYIIFIYYILLFITQICAKEVTGDRVKSSYEYDFSPILTAKDSKTPTFTSRNDQNAYNLYKEYKDSIYVDRYYNSSFALNIPLFTIKLPGRGRGVHSPATPNSTLNIGSSIVLSGLILAGVALFAPLIFPESRSGFQRAMDMKTLNNFVNNQMDDFSEHVFGQKLKREDRRSVFKTLERQFGELSTNIIHSLHESIEDLPHFPAKRVEECVKWCVCEAHKRPKRYGYLGKLFRSIFPYNRSQQTIDSHKVLANYHKPAKHGRDETVSCDDTYDDCSVTIAEVIHEFNVLASHRFAGNRDSNDDKSFISKMFEYYFDI